MRSAVGVHAVFEAANHIHAVDFVFGKAVIFQ